MNSPDTHTQAQPIPWPSNDLWTLGFKTLTGLGTVDKYMREPSLFNPILGIEDFSPACYTEERPKGDSLDPPSRIALIFKVPQTALSREGKEEDWPLKTQGRLFWIQAIRVLRLNLNIEADPENRKAFSDLKPNPSKAKHPLPQRRDTHPSLQEEKLKTILSRIHFEEFCSVPPIGTAGGLAMCWMKGVDCKIESADKFRITACISSDPPGKPWIFMGIYGPPVYAKKEVFWNDLGDYGCNIARYSFNLRRTVQRSGLIDLGFLGTKFTWFKKGSSSTRGTCLKRARLDRALASVDWRLAWPNAIVSHLTASSSDHSPILLDSCGGRHCTKPQFKYELMWERDPRVYWVVKKAWTIHSHDNPMVNMYRKLKVTKDHLRKWNISHFRKLSTQISEALFINKFSKIFMKSQRRSSLVKFEWLFAGLNIQLEEDLYLTPNEEEGDPLSPALFILASDILSRKIGYAEDEGGCPIPWTAASEGHTMVCKQGFDRPCKVPTVLTPLPGWMTCCTDVTIDSNYSFGAGVFRDSKNRICSVVADHFSVTDPTLAEASMLLSAARHAAHLNFNSVNFFCDNDSAVSSIREAHDIQSNLNLDGVSTHFKTLSAQFVNWNVKKINRNENFMAHNAFGDIQITSMDPKVFEDYKEWWPDPG
ncbi:hypothetical protein F8388_008651 [Cannabis sativa]|uniref:RNase H type-1 domain-containing protein n=1 Tax=Cannabis sativa TaxID=3483 RepID=A0A7J6GGY3_CANSA|nr:hypothetical protein F8388_008651 [Cannabis sativa]